MRSLDPRTKIVIIVCISAVAMMTKRLGFLIGLLAASIVLMLLMGVSISRMKKQLAAVIGMVLFLFVLQTVFGQWQLGLVLCIRLLILLMSALILLTGSPRDYLLAMVQARMPYELAYMVNLAFHFFPILREEAMDIYYSIQLRGTELQKTTLRKKLSAFRHMCIPVLSGALSRARDTAIAMEARGFRAKPIRTYMRKLELRKKDAVVMILIPMLSFGFAAAALLWHPVTDEFMVVGDVQYTIRDRDYEVWSDFMKQAISDNPGVDFALFTGDMVDNPASDKDWDAFFKNEERALGDLAIYTSPGNHETSVTPDRYLKEFDLPENGPSQLTAGEVYSFEYEDVHIVSLNSCMFMDERLKGEPDIETEIQAVHDWLEADLSNSDAAFKVVFMHHPMYPVVEDSDLYKRLRENWEQIFNNCNVDICFCGHQHAYCRTGTMGSGSSEGDSGVTYIMTNSGQKPSHYINEEFKMPSYIEKLYEEPVYTIVKLSGNNMTSRKMTVEIYDRNETLVDKVEKLAEQ